MHRLDLALPVYVNKRVSVLIHIKIEWVSVILLLLLFCHTGKTIHGKDKNALGVALNNTPCRCGCELHTDKALWN